MKEPRQAGGSNIFTLQCFFQENIPTDMHYMKCSKNVAVGDNLDESKNLKIEVQTSNNIMPPVDAV